MVKKRTHSAKLAALIGLLVATASVRADSTESVSTETLASFAPETVAPVQAWSERHILNQEIVRLKQEVEYLDRENDELLGENDELRTKVETLLALLAQQRAVVQ